MKKILRLPLALVMCLIVASSAFMSVSAATTGVVKKFKAAKVTTSSITLSWEKAEGVTGYKIYLYDSADKKWENIKTTKDTVYKLTSLESAKTYKFRVRTYIKKSNSVVYGNMSETLAVTTLPETPSSFKAKAESSSKITLSWNKVNGATGYRLFIYDETAKKWTGFDSTKKTSLTVDSLNSAKAYKFRIKAYKTVGEKKIYSDASKTLTVITPPKTPTGFKATSVSGTQATFTWKAVSGASAYRVYKYDSAKKSYVLADTVKSTSYTAKALKENTAYKFRVKAVATVSGKTKVSVESALCKIRTAPAAVTGVKVTDNATKNVSLSWNSMKGATGYEVVRVNIATGQWMSVGLTKETSLTVKQLSPAVTYKFKVRAYTENEGSATAYGAYSKELTTSTNPLMPRNAKGTAKGGAIKLSWSKSSGATGYEVYRYDAVDGSWKLLAKPTTLSYTDSTVKETTIYSYKLRAYLTVGEKIYYSNYTDHINVSFKVDEGNTDEYISQMEKDGIFGYLYSPEGRYFYTAADPWQRVVGYNAIFDTLAPITFINFDTERVYFTYDSKDWLVQFWKGQYGLIFYGAEIGVYNKLSTNPIAHYACAEDDERIKMSMTFYQRKNIFNENSEWVAKFTRPYGDYWWCTGFLPGNVFGNYQNLRIDARITLYDYDMLLAFLEGLDKTSIKYSVKGLDVYISYT